VGPDWAGSGQKDADYGQRAETVEWAAVLQSLSLDASKTQLDDQHWMSNLV